MELELEPHTALRDIPEDQDNDYLFDEDSMTGSYKDSDFMFTTEDGQESIHLPETIATKWSPQSEAPSFKVELPASEYTSLDHLLAARGSTYAFCRNIYGAKEGDYAFGELVVGNLNYPNVPLFARVPLHWNTYGYTGSGKGFSELKDTFNTVKDLKFQNENRVVGILESKEILEKKLRVTRSSNSSICAQYSIMAWKISYSHDSKVPTVTPTSKPQFTRTRTSDWSCLSPNTVLYGYCESFYNNCNINIYKRTDLEHSIKIIRRPEDSHFIDIVWSENSEKLITFYFTGENRKDASSFNISTHRVSTGECVNTIDLSSKLSIVSMEHDYVSRNALFCQGLIDEILLVGTDQCDTSKSQTRIAQAKNLNGALPKFSNSSGNVTKRDFFAAVDLGKKDTPACLLNLTTQDEHACGVPVFSPDGSCFITYRRMGNLDYHLYLVDSCSGEKILHLRRLNDPKLMRILHRFDETGSRIFIVTRVPPSGYTLEAWEAS
ncbi:hypothetical protein TWF694_009383 [Orbilia ellipsospora]